MLMEKRVGIRRVIGMKRLLLAGLLVILTARPAGGAVVTLNAFMSGAYARPQNLGAGFGYANATVDDVTGQFVISGTARTALPAAEVSTRGPNNPPADELGPLVLNLSFSTMPATPPNGYDTTFSGSTVLGSSQVLELLAGRDVVLVHAAQGTFEGPDIGGSLVTPEPSCLGLRCLLAIALPRRGGRRMR
jgi:hypothetical protein